MYYRNLSQSSGGLRNEPHIDRKLAAIEAVETKGIQRLKDRKPANNCQEEQSTHAGASG